jgi:hypothetical protein
MDMKVIYFVGSDLRVKKDSLDELKKMEGFDRVYPGMSGGVLPSNGYVALFEVKNSRDVVNIGEKISCIPGAEPAIVTSQGSVRFSDKKALQELIDYNDSN